MKSPEPDALATGLVRIDSDGDVTWMNRSARDLLGPSAPPGSGDRRRIALPPTLDSWMRRVQRTGRPMRVPETQLAYGQPHIDISLQPDRGGVLIELHPVTERIRQREITDKADRNQAIALLSRRLAHELRNPLAGVRGAAQLIEARSDDAPTRRHAGMIQREVDRITALIEQFAGDGESHMATVNLHRIVDESVELIAAESRGQIRIDRDFDPSIPEIRADGDRLHQLFLNLLRNCVQAGARTIHLSTRIEHHSPLIDEPDRPAVRIDVDDDGRGVPEFLRDRLFLPLVSGRNEGSGFGLAIVQQIARAHGGLVEHEPLDSGSRFRIRLPLVPAAESTDE